MMEEEIRNELHGKCVLTKFKVISILATKSFLVYHEEINELCNIQKNLTRNVTVEFVPIFDNWTFVN